MFTDQQKAKCVLWYESYGSALAVKRKFRIFYHVNNHQTPSENSILNWYRKFGDTGSVRNKRRSGRPAVPDANQVRVREAFKNSPTLSVRRASLELDMPRSTVHKVTRKHIKNFPYKITLLHELKPEDLPKRFEMSCELLRLLEENPFFLKSIGFSDECIVWVCGKVNRQNVRFWGTERPDSTRTFERDSPKVIVWCAVLYDRVIGPFFFHEPTVRWDNYLDMLENYAIPQLLQAQAEWGREIIFQQDGAPPHWAHVVRDVLDESFPGRWLGRDGPMAWAPRSPDLTPPDFYLWGYVKDKVFKTPVRDVLELKQRITAAIQSITPETLRNVWRELEVRLDVCRATNGSHVEKP